ALRAAALRSGRASRPARVRGGRRPRHGGRGARRAARDGRPGARHRRLARADRGAEARALLPPALPLGVHRPLPARVRIRLRAVGQLAGKPELEELAGAAFREDAEAFGSLVKKLQLERFCIQLCHWFCFFRCRVFCRCVCRPPFDNPFFTHVGDFHIYADIDPGTGLTNKAVFGHGGPDFGFFGCLRLLGFCPKESPNFPGFGMRYRFLYQELPSGSATPLVGDLLCGVNVGYRLITWPDVDTSTTPFTTKATSSSQTQTVAVQGSGATPGFPTPPNVGDPWYAPPTHVIVPDADGWIVVDPFAGDDGFYGPLIGFDTTQPFPDGNPAPGVPAGTEVPLADQRNGRDVAIVFEATRVGVAGPPDFTNSLSRARINNWAEVALLNLLE